MSTVRFSISLPDETHSSIEVSVEQLGQPTVAVSVTVPDGNTVITDAQKSKLRLVGKGAPTVNDEYALGGYAGI
jgi:hypothetical protein